MTLSRPSPPADDLTQDAARHALQAIRRPEAERDTCLPSIDDPSGRPNRQTVQTSSTILEHTRVSNYRPRSCHHSSTPAQCKCWTSFNGLLRWSDCRLQHQLDQDTTGLRRLSSTMHVCEFDNSEHAMNEHVLGIYTRAAWRTCVSSRVSNLEVRTAIPRFACCGARAVSHVGHRRRHASR